MKQDQAIGFFDSGVGGTSIWKEIYHLLPYEHTIYLADSANAPYGNKSPEDIVALCQKNTEKLIELGCKVIVVACNTATTNAIAHLRAQYNIPFIGIEPAIKPAALKTTTKSIGILATRGTLSSALFHETTSAFTKDIGVVEVIGEGLVPLIESAHIDSVEIESLLKKYMVPMLDAKIDYLVLGCTHYPYLIPVLKRLLPNDIQIIDSGAAVAKQTLAVLERFDLLRKTQTTPQLQFYTNSSTKTLQILLANYQSKISIEELHF